jgi:hypothetical protein
MGYSNVQGDLNVFSSTSTGSLIARGDTILYGNLSALAGSHTFGNLTAANLTVTGNFTVTATNTQVSNALSINNAGTTTALKVVQFEGGGPGHAHNVAEFWDYTTLAMVIDPEGNVGIHTTSSPGYSLTLAGGCSLDAVTASLYTGNGSGLSNLQSSSLVGPLAASQLQAAQTNITSLGTITTANVGTLNVATVSNLQSLVLGTNVYAPTANVGTMNVATISNLNSLVLVNNLYAPNALSTTNVFVSNGLDVGPGTLGTNVVIFSNISGGANVFVMDSNGRVGLGTTTPGNYLQSIYSNVTNSHMLLSTDTSSLGPQIQFRNRNAGGTVLNSYVKGDQGSLQFLTQTYSAVYLADSVQTYYVGGVERMRMTSVGMSIAKLANPTATLDVTGNIYASNALSATNVFATTANVGTLNVATISNLNSLVLLNNLYASNALSATNVLATTANVGTLNVATVSNLSTLILGTNVYVPTANVGTLNVATISNLNSLVLTNNLYASNALQTTNLLTTTANVGTLNVVTISNLNSLVLLNNLYAPNAVTTTNLFSNTLTASSIAVTGNIYASNAVVTTNVVCAGFTSNASNTVFNFSTLTIPFVQCTTLNAASTANVLTLSVPGSVGQTSLTVSGNTSVSNSITTTNLFVTTATVPGFTSQFTVNGGGTVTWSAAGNLLWSQRVMVIPAWRNAAYATGGYWDIYCPTSGTIISNGGTVTCTAAGIPVSGWFALYYRVVPGTGSTSVQSNFLIKDYTDTTYSPDSNWILLAVRNGDSGEIKWMPGNTTIPLGGTFYTPSASYDKVQVAGTVVVDSARTGIFTNLYSANALSTTNVFSTTANVGTLNVYTISNLNSLVLLNNLYASNSLSTTNVFVDKGLDVGPGTLGSNVVIFSNASGGANTFVMDSNGRVSIGAASGAGGSRLSFGQTIENKIITLYDGNSGDNPTSATNFYGFGMIGNSVRYQVPTSTTDRHSFFGGSTEYARITSTGISILTGAAPNANLHVAGNIYASNALSTTNVFSTTANVGTLNAATISNLNSLVLLNNLYAPNALSTTNLLATTANVGTLNVATISNLNSLVLTNNLYTPNALSTTNIFASTAIDIGPATLGTNVAIFANSSGGSNVLVMASSGYVGIGTASPGAQLDVYSTASASPGATVTNSGGSITINAGVNAIYFSTGGTVRGYYNAAGFSPNADLATNLGYASGPRWNYVNAGTVNLNGGGANVYAANAVTTTNLLATTANVGTLNVATISNLNTLVLLNNLYAPNALSTTNLLATTANVGTLNVATISNLNSLVLVNNLYASNALTATNVFATTANVGTLNVWQVSNLANLTVSNTLTTTNIVAAGFSSNTNNTVFNFDTLTIPFVNSTTLNVASTANLAVVTLTSLTVTGNISASNALTTTNILTTTANVGTLNVATISNLNTLVFTNNLYASNALSAPNVFVTTANIGTLNVWQVSNLQSLTLGTNVYAPTANIGTLNVATVSNLQNLVLGNALTTTNVFATRANVGTLNVTTVSTNSLIPVSSGIFMNLAATYSLTGTTNWTGNIAGTITSNLYTLFGGGITADWTALGSNPLITGPTANGGFKFGAVGPYSFTVVLSTDNNIKTLAVSSNTSDVHSNLANPGVWLYCYRFAVGHDPSTPVTLPFYVNDTNNYYYIDFETVRLTDQIHKTAYTNVATDTYTGSYVLVRPI